MASFYIQRFGLLVHLDGDLIDDLLQLAAYLRRQAVPELGVGDQKVVADSMVGLGHVLLHFVVFLRVDVRPGIVLGIHHASLQALIDLGEGHLARHRTQGTVLRGLQIGWLHAELLSTRVAWLDQRLIGAQLAHAVKPISQAGDALVFHRAQHRLAFIRVLEALRGGHVIEQEHQIEQLQLLGVLLQFGGGRRQHLHFTKQQGFHLLAIAIQR
ncbi:hypothetical protein D9M68_808690 [compost metagenome]